MVRGVSALRDDEKKEERVNRPREPLMSLVDWAKSGGVEGFSLRGALRLPSFKVSESQICKLLNVVSRKDLKINIFISQFYRFVVSYLPFRLRCIKTLRQVVDLNWA